MPNLELFNALTCDPMDLIEQAGDAMEDRARWPQRLVELFDVEFAYSKRKMDADAAAHDAAARTILIADYLGGSSIYLPRGDALRQAVHEASVYARHKGNNHDELAREIGITTTKLYELLAREKRRRLRKMQGRLFES